MLLSAMNSRIGPIIGPEGIFIGLESSEPGSLIFSWIFLSGKSSLGIFGKENPFRKAGNNSRRISQRRGRQRPKGIEKIRQKQKISKAFKILSACKRDQEQGEKRILSR